MSEPTRPIHQPRVDRDGSLVAHTVATPTSFKVRARMTVGSRKVIPVIFVPGIMGSNLRARSKLPDSHKKELKPGQAAWRPPSNLVDGYKEMTIWSERHPAQRQLILDGNILEVDPTGELDPRATIADPTVRERGWGEVHSGSYGQLLLELQQYLDNTFEKSPRGGREVRSYWRRVMQCDPARWGVRQIDHVTEPELEKYAQFQYPVYAFGYNWLDSCENSGKRLRERIDSIKKFWLARKHECKQVILVTHSMGGLVARACARQSGPGDGSAPDIAGIIHAVMPALGAPVAYRRIASGTEGGRYSNLIGENLKADAFALIAGKTSATTTPVMALAPGVLQLLPNHLYPKPWLVVKTVRMVNRRDEVRDLLSLPAGNPYDFYRDMESWYRMIDPNLADPAKLYHDAKGGVVKAITQAIDEAERFHTQVLMNTPKGEGKPRPYYHPNTYAFYGADSGFKAYGQIQWVAREPANGHAALTQANIRNARLVVARNDGSREVNVEQGLQLRFSVWPQDAHGDETVPVQSGSGPEGHVRQVFTMKGYRHQDSFQHSDVLLLTRHLIVKIVQGIK